LSYGRVRVFYGKFAGAGLGEVGAGGLWFGVRARTPARQPAGRRRYEAGAALPTRCYVLGKGERGRSRRETGPLLLKVEIG